MTRSTPSSFKLERVSFVAGALLLFSVLTPASAYLDGGKTPSGQSLEGDAIVVDGDTIEIAGQRVRLEGIDAPEVAQTCAKASGEAWDCGREAAFVLTALIAGKPVACDSRGQDKYGRMLGICFAEAADLNEAMVRNGFAWAFVKYSQDYVPVETEAQAARIGVWQGAAMPPWEFRHQGAKIDAAQAPSGCTIKGNVSKKGQIYHLPASAWYDKVKVDEARGERWFCSEAEAVAAGWRPVAQP